MLYITTFCIKPCCSKRFRGLQVQLLRMRKQIRQSCTMVRMGSFFSGVYTQLDGKFLKSKNYENGRLNLSAGIRLESVKTNIYDITNEDTVSLEIKNIYAQNKPLIEKRTTRPVGRVGANFAIAQGTNLRASIGAGFPCAFDSRIFCFCGRRWRNRCAESKST